MNQTLDEEVEERTAIRHSKDYELKKKSVIL